MSFPAGLNILLISLLLGVSSSAAQETIHVRGGPVCEECRIEVEPVATIGSLEGPGYLPGRPSGVAVDTRGRYFVTTFRRSHEVAVYTGNGTLLKRLGREGRGPGELLDVSSLLIARGDSLFAFDSGNGKAAVYGPDLDLVREFRFPIPMEYAPAVELPDGRVVVNAMIRSPDFVGYPLQLIDRTGTVLLSFGANDPVYRGDSPVLRVREISEARSGGIWSAPKTQYVVERFGPDGSLQYRVLRSVDWFQPYVHFVDPTPDRAPSPMLQSIREDRSGRLWVATAVPASDFHEGLSEPMRGEGGRRYSRYEDYGRVYEAVIEVLDPIGGEVLVRERVPGLPLRWTGNGELATYREPDGVPLMDLWHVTLVDP